MTCAIVRDRYVSEAKHLSLAEILRFTQEDLSRGIAHGDIVDRVSLTGPVPAQQRPASGAAPSLTGNAAWANPPRKGICDNSGKKVKTALHRAEQLIYSAALLRLIPLAFIHGKEATMICLVHHKAFRRDRWRMTAQILG
jgi:hypothetical protein